jgi:hypothetical protein
MKVPHFNLVAVPADNEALSLRRSEWLSPEIGTRHKIGGEPDFIMDEPTPICSCGSTMTFYAQLDSLNDDVMIGDAGLIYIFLCFDCFESKSLVQSH